LASSHDGYDDRAIVKGAVPAALDGRSEICRTAGCPTLGLQTEEFSGAYRDRTGDLRLAKPALSQLS
jgi:hypothetical protein